MLLLTKILAKQSTCNKRQVACIITKYGFPIAYGFNHGNKEQCGCSMDSKNPHVLHAEEMALSKPKDYRNSHLYVNYTPCKKCCDLIIKSGITKVTYYTNDKPDNRLYLQTNGVNVNAVHNP